MHLIHSYFFGFVIFVSFIVCYKYNRKMIDIDGRFWILYNNGMIESGSFFPSKVTKAHGKIGMLSHTIKRTILSYNSKFGKSTEATTNNSVVVFKNLEYCSAAFTYHTTYHSVVQFQILENYHRSDIPYDEQYKE